MRRLCSCSRVWRRLRGSKDTTGSSIAGTLNVSSLDDDGTGDFGVHFVNAFSSATYQGLLSIPAGVAAGNSDGHFAGINSKAAGSCETLTWYGDAGTNATFNDWPYDIIIHGDLSMMAGKIIADQIEHSTAGSLDTQYVVNGSAKAWWNANGTGTIAINDSFNCSSISDQTTGVIQANFE